jgi:hypothetical protein
MLTHWSDLVHAVDDLAHDSTGNEQGAVA